MKHHPKHWLIYGFIALLSACGVQEIANTDLASTKTAFGVGKTVATQTTETTETTVIGTSPKRDLLANLALAYPGGVLPAERTAAAAEQLAQNPAVLKYSAASSPVSAQSQTISPQAAGSYTVGLSAPVQRAQNTTLFGSYFYSIFPSEMTNALATNPTWNLEGTAFHAYLGINPGLAPVYRFRNLLNGSYLYTIDETEKNTILANYGGTFTLEGTAWFASPAPATGYSPLYRFRNQTNGTYLFSAYTSERDAIIANYAGLFFYEGISYYVRQTAPLEISLLAGSGTFGSANGTGAAASFNNPEGVARDNVGNLYVVDSNNHLIRKITPAGVVTTFAGTQGVPGSTDATGTAAKFNFPVGIVYLPVNNLLMVTDSGNHTIRMVDMTGVVSTLAGLALTPGSTNGTWSAARFNNPRGITISADGNTLVVADSGNHTIRQIQNTGTVSTLAGLAGTLGSTNGTGTAALFNAPYGVAIDSSNNVYVADSNNKIIRKITPAGVVTTLAGLVGSGIVVDGTGSGARFANPWSIASDGASNLYVADDFAVRKVTTAGVVTTVVGTGVDGTFVPGLLPGVIYYPNGIVIGGGKTYITIYNHTVLQINGVP